MSNRYITEGITNDLRAGKRILLVGPNRSYSRHTFRNVAEAAQDAIYEHPIHTLHVSSGREYLKLHNGGELTVVTIDGIRGRTAEVVVLLEWEYITGNDLEVLDRVLPLLHATNGELVQA